MWIVALALRRPYTFVVMAMLIAILGVVMILRMPTDIFPEIDIPVIAAIWRYDGMPPDEMETRVIGNYERVLTTAVNDIEHIESQSLYGEGIVKIFFQPGARIEAATAQLAAVSQVVVHSMPPGITPPFLIRYSASNVPIVWISLGSETLSEQQVFDYDTNFLRPGIVTIPGIQIPWPYGGKQREVVVDLDPVKLFASSLSPQQVSDALNAQNLIIPAGTAKVGQHEFQVRLNSSPRALNDLNDLPVAVVKGTTVYLKDVAHVRDGFIPQTNMAHVDGKKGVLQPCLKNGGSTLDIVSTLKARLPGLMETLPPALKVSLLFDQSLYVRASVLGVVKEAAIAATLTAIMILVFLGSWRSTLIVLISIPLSILTSIIVLALLGQSLNVMTLGGMALAVGVLVDDATVEIENIHRNLAQGKPIVRAILDGAQQIATPAFVSTLCICIVFVPVVFISGAARSLFTPLAMSVVFAMLTSYLLSRTLVPTMVHYLLANESHDTTSLFGRFHEAFNRGFERLRRVYGGFLAWALDHRAPVAIAFAVFVVGSFTLATLVGRDFFPTVDAGQIKIHVRCPPATRIEESEKIFARVEQAVRELIPRHELKTVIDDIGIPNSGINMALSDGTLVSSAEGEILISLDEEEHGPTAEHVKTLRRELAKRFPDLTIFFQPPDMVTQVLNFGLPAPIDIQIVGPIANRAKNLDIARRIRDEVALIPGAVDVHLQQVMETPELHVDVDRSFAGQVGLTQRDVAQNALISLSSSGQTAPNFWLDPRFGVQYVVAVQTPQYKIDSLQALENTPIAAGNLREPQLLGNLSHVSEEAGPTNITHYNIAPTFDVLSGVQGADLGSVSVGVDDVVKRFRPYDLKEKIDERYRLPRGTSIVVRGQVESMRSSFRGLAFGLIFAIVLVYLLMVVNFQSWMDPFIIMMALPGALSGIIWMLYATGTTINVPSLMGAIMSIGVATANSILLITFANDQRVHGLDAKQAALAAGMTRLRPVMMTAFAMIVGMLPMAVGLGEGGEQNAPLGRAVIGGLAVATFATLFFVPITYSALRKRPPRSTELEEIHAG
ncbi:MAG TPA: efflux RND transporter permease subunit [Planctomycetota bacterium]|nr:efflux RND transporter permease subunit [Planctomycetota bacterium]